MLARSVQGQVSSTGEIGEMSPVGVFCLHPETGRARDQASEQSYALSEELIQLTISLNKSRGVHGPVQSQ